MEDMFNQGPLNNDLFMNQEQFRNEFLNKFY